MSGVHITNGWCRSCFENVHDLFIQQLIVDRGFGNNNVKSEHICILIGNSSTQTSMFAV